MHSSFLRSVLGLLAIGLACLANTARAQTFGVELHNTLMPAAGAMGGVSIAQPQDLTSALNANPATLTQFGGTQFTFSGAWAEPTFNLTQSSQIPVIGPPLIDPYSAKSTTPGSPIGNIGITQDLSEMGLPATFGLGFISTSGAGVDFRQVPASRGTNSELVIFNMPLSFGIELTERWSAGASMSLGIAYYDGPFVGASGMTPDYALRGTVGSNYKLTECTNLGAYYQTKQGYRFDNAFTLNPGLNQVNLDVNMDLPQNIGIGLANTSFMDGNLLLGVDVLYKLWENAAMYDAVYENQWVLQVGSQYTMGRIKLRAGYVWAENPMNQSPSLNIGGIVQPGEFAAVRYTQGLLAVANQHRISAGIGVKDAMPGIDLDLMAGGMFRNSEQLGAFTTATVESYWVGAGLTWRFGANGEECVACAPME